MAELVDEVTDVLQHMIRNACVNDGTLASGQESRNADLLRSYLEGGGLDLESYEPVSGRASLVTRIEGSDPSAPSLLLVGHTDVVPATPERWRRDPFGGELVDGIVWGRGAIDMLNMTASMAVAVRHLADRGWRPRGTLILLAVADEEAGGRHGAEWLTEQHPDAIRADYALTELGGATLSAAEPRLALAVGEKGAIWGTIRVAGTPGHGSMPLRSDNALATAAEVVRRLVSYRPPARVDDVWRQLVAGIDLPHELADALADPERIDGVLDTLPDPGTARFAHACTHVTVTPTMLRAGVKNNVIPDSATIGFDVRALPGDREEDVVALLEEALGDLADRVEIRLEQVSLPTASPLDSPLRDVVDRVTRRLVAGATTVPYLLPGGTDARFVRRLGAVAYGYTLFSPRFSFADLTAMFHGDDERVDQASLELTTALWTQVARELLE